MAVTQLAAAITKRGSTAAIQRLGDGQYDAVLDAVALADTVIYWPPDGVARDNPGG